MVGSCGSSAGSPMFHGECSPTSRSRKWGRQFRFAVAGAARDRRLTRRLVNASGVQSLGTHPTAGCVGFAAAESRLKRPSPPAQVSRQRRHSRDQRFGPIARWDASSSQRVGGGGFRSGALMPSPLDNQASKTVTKRRAILMTTGCRGCLCQLGFRPEVVVRAVHVEEESIGCAVFLRNWSRLSKLIPNESGWLARDRRDPGRSSSRR